MRKGLSEKEIEVVSYLELKKKYFFTLNEISRFFKNKNEQGVYIFRLRKKSRIIKLNKNKYFLVPIKAIGSKWSEHPFIIIDEMMNSRNYCIVGKAAAYYWKLIEQIPFSFEVWNTKKHGKIKIFNVEIGFKKHKISELPKSIERKIEDHKFLIATKEESKKWI